MFSLDSSEADHNVGPAVAAVMKLSFNEEYRSAISTLGIFLQHSMYELVPLLALQLFQVLAASFRFIGLHHYRFDSLVSSFKLSVQC
jgi:hypothetical protein